MKAVMSRVPPEILAWRKETGADQWDEVWNGVLHMVPCPNREHQDLVGSMEALLRFRWARPRGAKVYHDINLAPRDGWPNNYRIPDLVLLTPERFDIDRNEYFEGAPDVVVEIHSPGDEAYEKLEFYAGLGVPEVWIVDRDSKRPEIHKLTAEGYEEQKSEPDGWLKSRATGVELRQGRPGKLEMRVAGDDSVLEEMPAD
jgi:Uma2 family endonuclease